MIKVYGALPTNCHDSGWNKNSVTSSLKGIAPIDLIQTVDDAV